MLVKLDDVRYVYDKKTVMEKNAVSNISLEINEGEFVALLGTSGCGKSTLLSIIAGFGKPNNGRVEVGCNYSMMFQNPENQLFDQTVLGDVMYGPKNLGLDLDDAKKAAIGALQLVKVDESLFEEDPSNLSGGQKRKIALAGILAMNRPLVLLDEPTANLDNRSSKEIMNAISDLNKQGVTVIIATHDFDVAVNYASRVVVMDEGKIVLDVKPSQIVSNVDSLQEYGINIPKIYLLSSYLYKKGLIKDTDCSTAQTLFDSLKINKK